MIEIGCGSIVPKPTTLRISARPITSMVAPMVKITLKV